ncbi:MAG: NAD-dependent epimerase/dehydratase family protein [Candidatus Thorarchaeota archaeon]
MQHSKNGVNMRVLVTGGAGFIGTKLVPMLLSEGYSVRVIDNLMYGGFGLLGNLIDKKFEFINGDITNENLMRKILQDTDYVIHLAALVGYPACDRDPELAEKVNVKGTQMLTKCLTPEQKLIYSSTGSVYGEVKNELCTEETPTNALSIYGETKLKAEQLTLEHDASVVYRFATAFGLSPRLRLDLLINNFVYQAVKNKQLIVYQKSFKRTFIHIHDIARSFVFALKNHEKMAGQVYNVGDNTMNYTKEEICNMIKEKVKYYLYFADYDGDKDKRNYEVSYEKINNAGFHTEVTMSEGIEELIKAMELIEIPNIYSNHLVI